MSDYNFKHIKGVNIKPDIKLVELVLPFAYALKTKNFHVELKGYFQFIGHPFVRCNHNFICAN